MGLDWYSCRSRGRSRGRRDRSSGRRRGLSRGRTIGQGMDRRSRLGLGLKLCHDLLFLVEDLVPDASLAVPLVSLQLVLG